MTLSEDRCCSHHKHCFCYFLVARQAAGEQSETLDHPWVWRPTKLNASNSDSSQSSGHFCAGHFRLPNLLTQSWFVDSSLSSPSKSSHQNDTKKQDSQHKNSVPFLTLLFLAQGSECLKMKIIFHLFSASGVRLVFLHNPWQ